MVSVAMIFMHHWTNFPYVALSDITAIQPLTTNQVVPSWITLLGDDLSSGYYFEAIAFDVDAITADEFKLWYGTKLATCNWAEFTTKISALVGYHAKPLEDFFSCEKSPKAMPRRLMHSSERHNLALWATGKFPLLASKFNEFKRHFTNKEDPKQKVYKTTFRDENFYVSSFIYVIGSSNVYLLFSLLGLLLRQTHSTSRHTSSN